MIITSAIDNAARMAKAESLKSACEKTSILSVLFPSEGFETTELSKRKRKVHRHILHRWDLCNYENLCQDLTSWTKKDQEIADMLLALTIATSNLPVTFVHNSFFKIYVNYLNHQVEQSYFYAYFFMIMCTNVFRRKSQVY